MGCVRDFKQRNDTSDSKFFEILVAVVGRIPWRGPESMGRGWISLSGRDEGTSDRGSSTESRQEKDPGGRMRKQADSRLRSEGRYKERFPEFR